MPRAGDARICVIHKNVPNMISPIAAALSENGMNIENMQSKSKKDYAYTILDVTGQVSEAAIAAIQAIDGVVRVRVIQ